MLLGTVKLQKFDIVRENLYFKMLCVVKYYTVITSIEQMQMFQLSNPFQDVNKVKNYCSVIWYESAGAGAGKES